MSLKEASHKRHISYCRRSQARSRIRPRSCRACNAAKVKCTFQSPCRRCTDKGRECVYEVRKAVPVVAQVREVISGRPHDGQVVIEARRPAVTAAYQGGGNTISSASETQPVDVGGQVLLGFDLSNTPITLEDILASSEMQTAFAPGTFNTIYASHGSNGMQLEPPSGQSMQHMQRMSSPSLMWPPYSIQPRMGAVEQAPWSTWTSSVTVDSTLLTPELNKALSYTQGQELAPSLQQIRSSNSVVQHSTRLIIQGLRAYPMMVLRRETLPPFIHPHWHRQITPSLPEPLSICMSIAHMYAFRSEETRPFLWRTVQAEDERFLAQVHRFPVQSRGKLLMICFPAQAHVSARPLGLDTSADDLYDHALCRWRSGSARLEPAVDQDIPGLYFLAVLPKYPADGGRCYANDLGSSTTRGSVSSTTSLSVRAGRNGSTPSRGEGRRRGNPLGTFPLLTAGRTACVFFLICRCISVSTGIEGCDAFYEFTNLPLASPKTLWEAKTRAEWEAEYTAYSAGWDTGMHTMGMLIDAHNRSREDMSKSTLLDLWNARTDNLGELLNIVTSMV